MNEKTMNEVKTTAETATAQPEFDAMEKAIVERTALENRLRETVKNDGYALATDPATGKQYACYKAGETMAVISVADMANKGFRPRAVYIPAEIDPNGVLLEPAIATACRAKYDRAIMVAKNRLSRCKKIEDLPAILKTLCELHYVSRDGADRNTYSAADVAIMTENGDVDTYAEKIRRVIAYYIDGSVNTGFDFKEFAETISAAGLSTKERTDKLKKLSDWLENGYKVESRIKPVNAVVRTQDVKFLESTFTKGLSRKNKRVERTFQNDEFIAKTMALYMVDLFQKNGADEKRFAKLIEKTAKKSVNADKKADEKPAK